jgi:L-asparaginase
MTIKILVTGGTFDKEYMELTGELIFKNTHIHEILELARCKTDIKIRTLMMIDSLDMTDYHRNIILEKCKNSKEKRIIITHGTDTIAKTALYLGKEIKDRTIVLTGALIPYAFGSSDGLFNLGSALAFVQSLPSGVYIAMNGKYFNYDNVRKNKNTGVFEEIRNE